MASDTVKLSIPLTAVAPRAARRGVVDGFALEGQLAVDVALLVSEAVTNSVLHAGLTECDLVHVDAWRYDGGLHVEVCDEGAGMCSPSPAGRREGGRGLDLIGALAQRWGVHSDGHTRIWFDVAG